MNTRARKSDESMSAEPLLLAPKKNETITQKERGQAADTWHALRKTAAHRLFGDGSGFSSYSLKDGR